MKILLSLIFLSLTGVNAYVLNGIPLNAMRCSGPFLPGFFKNLTLRPDLNPFVTELGRHPKTIYQFELYGEVFTSPPTFNGGHIEEYVFLSTGDQGLTVSRFVLLDGIFHLMAQHPVTLEQDRRVLQYRQIRNPELPPDWICKY